MLARVDALGQGRVQVLAAGENELTQAAAAVAELQRLSRLDVNWEWSGAAVIARNWRASSLCVARAKRAAFRSNWLPRTHPHSGGCERRKR